MLQTLGLFLLLGASANTQPTVGSPAPDFSLKDLEGRTFKLSEKFAQGTVVLIVLRGFPGYQCPYCSRQVRDFVRQAHAFESAGARLVFIYPGPSAELQACAREFAAGKNIPATVDFLLDPDYGFTNLYGLRWDAPKETAYPSTLIIKRGGEIAFVNISRTHGGRTSARDIIDRLQAAK